MVLGRRRLWLAVQGVVSAARVFSRFEVFVSHNDVTAQNRSDRCDWIGSLIYSNHLGNNGGKLLKIVLFNLSQLISSSPREWVTGSDSVGSKEHICIYSASPKFFHVYV